MTDSTSEVCFPATWQPEDEQILPPFDELTLTERGKHLRDLGWSLVLVEGFKGLFAGQSRRFDVAFDTPGVPLLHFEFCQMVQVLAECPVLSLGRARNFLRVTGECRQPQQSKQ
jgi:hypothetical protein